MKISGKFLFMGVDLILSACAIGLSILIRFEGEIPARFITPCLYFFTIAPVCVVVFYLFGLYEKVWRYAGLYELITIVYAVSTALAPYLIFSFVTSGSVFPRGIVAIAWFANIFFLGGIRFVLRLVSERARPHKSVQQKRVLIVGANDIGELALREMQRQKGAGYIPVGFIDDDLTRAHVMIHGVPVLGTKETIAKVIENKSIDELIIALSSPSYVRELVSRCEKLKVALKIIPSISEILDGKIAVNQIREVQIEDLLERAPVTLDLERLSSYIKNNTVLVTGAGGSIGSEICRQVLRLEPRELVLLGHGENSIHEIWLELSSHTAIPLRTVIGDIKDRSMLNWLFENVRPQVVFHAAAHKHVPLMEHNSREAIKNNVKGTRNLVEAAGKYGVERFIFLSTDKAVNPVSVMGASKRIAEILVATGAAHSSTKFIAVRFGNVLGSRGSVIPTFKHQIKSGGPVTVTHADMTRYFMTIPEAVQLVIQAGAIGERGEIYMLDMGKPIKILDLAKNLIRLSGYEVGRDIRIEIQGSRPGEKLEEELVNVGETISPTGVEKILKVHSCALDRDAMEKMLSDLEAALEKNNEETVKKLLLDGVKLFSCAKNAAQDP
ncbi:MAG: nucleoside-diphosphate sugar epimerase/dehydratase [Candidatus Eremiobacteraeota bacterium]|nr:nucleoside-diphosphate sugar epimerase/dehydratase [Candidatus Eremiobacteraeota bacterium]